MEFERLGILKQICTERSRFIILFKRMTDLTYREEEVNSGQIDTLGHTPELSTYAGLLGGYPDC